MATRGLRTLSVLLVNDTLEQSELYARTLRAGGHRVIIPEDSVAAYQIATTRPPEIIVTDVRISGSFAGLELTRRLRSNKQTSAVGIIVITTLSRPHDADVAVKAGADTVLETPVSGSLLMASIERLLQRSGRQTSQRLPQPAPASKTDALEDGCEISTTPAPVRGACPCCGSTIVYRERWPLLAADVTQGIVGRVRLRYVAGWFCTNPACDHRQ